MKISYTPNATEKIQKNHRFYNRLIHAEAIESMQQIKNKSINLICVDLPYGVTNNKWDSIIPLDKMWEQFNRIIVDDGVIVLTATQPFSSMLIMSNLKQFKYEIIWEKTVASGQLNVKHQPLRVHESVLVFYKKKSTYNEQLTEGKPYSINRKAKYSENNYNQQKPSKKENTGFRHARSIIKVPNPRIKGGHPTQKPLALMEYLIKTYSNEKDVVLDCCMGSGTTGAAALGLGRKFIGIELDNRFFGMAQVRLEKFL